MKCDHSTTFPAVFKSSPKNDVFMTQNLCSLRDVLVTNEGNIISNILIYILWGILIALSVFIHHHMYVDYRAEMSVILSRLRERPYST